MMLVFPNYAAKPNGNSIALEHSHALLLDPLTEQCGVVGVVAPLDVSDREVPSRAVTNPLVRFISLGVVGERTSRIAKLLEYVVMQRRIMAAIRSSDFCYIFLPGYVGLLACVQCLIWRTPYALYLRAEWSLATPRLLYWLPPIIVRRARFIVCAGARLAMESRTQNARSEAVVPMSPLLARGAPGVRQARPAGNIRLLFVGAVVREKGVYELIDALVLLGKRTTHPVELTIAGIGAERASLEEYGRKCGVEGRVRFLGYVGEPDDLAALYASHDVLCLPTYTEGFPRVVYEAMAFGLPCVTTRVGQIDSVIEEGINGLFAKVGSATDLADKLSLLIDNPALRQQIAERARATIAPMLAGWRASTHGRQVLDLMREQGMKRCAE